MPESIKLPFANSHAFLVGINDYQKVSSLHSAIPDIEAVGQKLEEKHGFTTHYLKNATLDEIRQLLRETIPQLIQKRPHGTPQDRILFYFAGHGVALKASSNPDGSKEPMGYLVPADAQRQDPESFLPMTELTEAVEKLPCDHGLIFLDCCFAGAIRWAANYRNLFAHSLPHQIYERRFQKYCTDPAWQVICSAAHDQKALDVVNNNPLGSRKEADRVSNSPFALSLLSALDGAADCIPINGGDGLITATELYLYLRDQVEGETMDHSYLRQTPSLFHLPFHDKGEFVFQTPGHRLNLKPSPHQNPFKGLVSYEEEDSDLFYGRAKIAAALLAHVNENPLTVVVGASGTGKSSLIKSGVLPELRKLDYEIMPIFRPGKSPMAAWQKEFQNSIKQNSSRAKVFVIDQFEELITQTTLEAEAIEFQSTLQKLIEVHPHFRFILSVRSDFEPQFTQNLPLSNYWIPARFPITPFTTEELREVIIQPAVQEVYTYESDKLINQIVDEVSQAPGGLPLLSFTLSEIYHLYENSGNEDRIFREAYYQQLGGVIGSLQTRANKLYQRLDSDSQLAMQRLMLRMVALEGGETAGKRVFLEELIFPDPKENQRVQDILDELVDEARLVVRGKDLEDRPYIEPAHDALVKSWGRLWEWIKTTGEERLVLRNKLIQSVAEYENHDQSRNLLWNNDPRLDILKAESESSASWLNEREQTFISESVKRRRFLRNRTVIALSLSSLILFGLAIFAFIQRSIAVDTAETLQITANSLTTTTDSLFIEKKRADSTTTVALYNEGKAQENLLISNRNLVTAYGNEIEVQKGVRLEETRRARLAEVANLIPEQKQHLRRIQKIDLQIKSIIYIRDSLEGEINKQLNPPTLN